MSLTNYEENKSSILILQEDSQQLQSYERLNTGYLNNAIEDSDNSSVYDSQMTKPISEEKTSNNKTILLVVITAVLLTGLIATIVVLVLNLNQQYSENESLKALILDMAERLNCLENNSPSRCNVGRSKLGSLEQNCKVVCSSPNTR